MTSSLPARDLPSVTFFMELFREVGALIRSVRLVPRCGKGPPVLMMSARLKSSPLLVIAPSSAWVFVVHGKATGGTGCLRGDRWVTNPAKGANVGWG